MLTQEKSAITLKAIEDLVNKGRYEEAERAARASKVPPSTKAAIIGVISLKQQNLVSAEASFKEALRLDPKNWLAHVNYASQLTQQKRSKSALHHSRIAYEINQKNELGVLVYAAALSESDQNPEAERVLRAFIEECSQPSLKVLTSLAAVVRANLRPSEAYEILSRAKMAYPKEPKLTVAMAELQMEIDPEGSIEALSEALLIEQDSLSLKWNASFAFLRARQFKLGWEYFEYGLDSRIGKIGRPLPGQVRSLPLNNRLEDLDPSKITILSCEQGLGDQVLFLSVLREALPRIPKPILVGEERTVALYSRSFPEVPCYGYAFAHTLRKLGSKINGVFPIGSLMKYYRETKEDFQSGQLPYLVPDRVKVEKFRTRLAQRFPGQKLVGISWRGGHWERQVKTKSMEIESFLQIARSPNTRLVSLQYGDVKEDRRKATELGMNVTFIDGIDFKKDIDSWFALTCACDVVVSVSTALVHFAGAANLETHVLLLERVGPFIWGNQEGQSLPYPSVQVYKKQPGEEFASLLSRVSVR